MHKRLTCTRSSGFTLCFKGWSLHACVCVCDSIEYPPVQNILSPCCLVDICFTPYICTCACEATDSPAACKDSCKLRKSFKGDFVWTSKVGRRDVVEKKVSVSVLLVQFMSKSSIGKNHALHCRICSKVLFRCLRKLQKFFHCRN